MSRRIKGFLEVMKLWIIQYKSSVAPDWTCFDYEVYPLKRSATAQIKKYRHKYGSKFRPVAIESPEK